MPNYMYPQPRIPAL